MDERDERAQRRATRLLTTANAGVSVRAAKLAQFVQGERVSVTERGACFRTGAGASDSGSRVTRAPAQKAAESAAAGRNASGAKRSQRGVTAVPPLIFPWRVISG